MKKKDYKFAVSFLSDNGNYTILIEGEYFYEQAIKKAIGIASELGYHFHSLTCTQIVHQ